MATIAGTIATIGTDLHPGDTDHEVVLTCAFCEETSDLVRDYLTPVHNDYQEPAVLTLCRAHAARRANASGSPPRGRK